MDEKITLVTFTDPMMRLSYECEPVFRKIETHFAGKINFHYVMSGLVRDVYELVDPDDLKIGKDVAIKNYNEKLAEIYRMEENLGGLPINMDGIEVLKVFLDKNPLISPIELREAFNFGNIDEVKSFIEPLLQSNEFKIIEVPHGWFIEKVLEG